MNITNSSSVYYKDVNLIAQQCHVKSRSEVFRELNRIFVSPMSAIVGKKFAMAATELGLSVCLHRFCKVEDQMIIFKSVSNQSNVYCSVGLKDGDRIRRLSEIAVTKFCIDIANGNMHREIQETIDLIKKYSGEPETIIVGNIHTGEAFIRSSYKTKAKIYVRVGIGNGSACSTAIQTGYNRGQITEIDDCVEFKSKKKKIIADGHIKDSGCAAKAFGCGADFIMLGGYFKLAEEAETHQNNRGVFWGGASRYQMNLSKIKKSHSEGKEEKIEGEIKPLKDLVEELWGGISSAVSYSGRRTVSDFIGNGIFEFIH